MPEQTLKKLIDNKDYPGIEQALSDNPALANEEIPYDEMNSTKAHPLHRICDGVFTGKYTDEEAVEMARIFIEHGANVNGNRMEIKKDTPLIAAASLNADKVAILYIRQRSKYSSCRLSWRIGITLGSLVRKG